MISYNFTLFSLSCFFSFRISIPVIRALLFFYPPSAIRLHCVSLHNNDKKKKEHQQPCFTASPEACLLPTHEHKTALFLAHPTRHHFSLHACHLDSNKFVRPTNRMTQHSGLMACVAGLAAPSVSEHRNTSIFNSGT